MKDFVLVSLITLAEAESPLEHGVTLIVGGFLVSGFVVSYEKYMQHNPTTQSIETALQTVIPDSADTTKNECNFIHLRDAKYFTPGANPIPENMGLFIRLSLDSIQGFSIGILKPGQA